MSEVDGEFPLSRSRLTRQVREKMGPLLALILADAWRRRDIDNARWAGPLTLLLAEAGRSTAEDIGPRILSALGGNQPGRTPWAPEGTDNYLLEVARNISAGRLDQAREMLAEADPEVFEDILNRAGDLVEGSGEEMVDTAANFVVNDVAEVTGAAQKRWQVNSTNPRPEHAAMSGQTVPVGESFSNGLRYPRSGGGPAQTANCKCSMVIIEGGS